MPSRRTELNPVSENVTEYVPGSRSTILYCPCPSVVAVRTFSMSATLAASTVTPGSTAPDASLTTPAIPVPACCADAAVAASSNPAATRIATAFLESMIPLLCRFSSTVLRTMRLD